MDELITFLGYLMLGILALTMLNIVLSILAGYGKIPRPIAYVSNFLILCLTIFSIWLTPVIGLVPGVSLAVGLIVLLMRKPQDI
jgi:hypothetical protein